MRASLILAAPLALSFSTPSRTHAGTRLRSIADPLIPVLETPLAPEPFDLTRMRLSGMQGKALDNYANGVKLPTLGEVKKAIPDHCFKRDTATSMGHAAFSFTASLACVAAGIAFIPFNALATPLWAVYAAVTGTVMMGCWVLAHECGHGAFSDDKKLQDQVGYFFHSALLVPYFSWQRSHQVHHKRTNHMDLGETHVPERAASDGGAFTDDFKATVIGTLGADVGGKAWGALQSFLHLVIGWPAYLLIGATGGPGHGMTNHFYPETLDGKEPRERLFPERWAEKVYESDIGIGVTVGLLILSSLVFGGWQTFAVYGGPYLVVNAWLVLYTWLQHTDVDVPHFEGEDHTFMKGAWHTIDRPYDKMDPFGIIDFLHHSIGSSHVAHHIDSSMPFYHAREATQVLADKFPEAYLYDPTPIGDALWRVAQHCTTVEKRDGVLVWADNEKTIAAREKTPLVQL